MAFSPEERQHDQARDRLVDALRPATPGLLLVDLVGILIGDRDNWKRIAEERAKDLQNATETNRSAAAELHKEREEAIAVLREDLGEASQDLGIVALAKRAAHQRKFWKQVAQERETIIESRDKTVGGLTEELKHALAARAPSSKPRPVTEEELTDLRKTIASLEDAAASLPAVLNSRVTLLTESNHKLDQELTRVRTTLTNFGIPEVEDDAMIPQHERVGRLGLLWAQEKTRADGANAQLAALVAADDFREKALRVKRNYEREGDEQFERVVWLRSYAKHRSRGRPIHTAIAHADEHIHFWQEGTHELRRRAKSEEGYTKSEFVRAAEHDAILDGLNVQVADLKEELALARACAQESADIMRRARDRADRYRKISEKAREVILRVTRWFGGTRADKRSMEVREFLQMSHSLLKEMDSQNINKEEKPC